MSEFGIETPGLAPRIVLKSWFACYLLGPVVLKLTLKVITRVMRSKATTAWSRLSPVKREKAALHVAKLIWYLFAAIAMLPILIQLYGKLKPGGPPTVITSPIFGASHKGYDYMRTVLSIPASLYLGELMINPNPGFMCWVHHGTVLLAIALINGVPWLTLGDAVIFAEPVAFIWGLLSWNFVFFIIHAQYHLQPHCPAKEKSLHFLQWYMLLGPCGIHHITFISVIAIRWGQFENWLPLVVLLVFDLAFLIEHISHFNTVRAMHRKVKQWNEQSPARSSDSVKHKQKYYQNTNDGSRVWRLPSRPTTGSSSVSLPSTGTADSPTGVVPARVPVPHEVPMMTTANLEEGKEARELEIV